MLYIMHWKFSRSVPEYTVFICKFKTDVLFIHEKFLVHKLETSRNCKELKHIMILIIAIIYIFHLMWYLITFENYFRKILRHPWKNLRPPFHSLSPKNSEIASPSPFLTKLKIFQPPVPPAERKGVGGGRRVIVSKSIINRKSIYLSEFSYSYMGSIIQFKAQIYTFVLKSL